MPALDMSKRIKLRNFVEFGVPVPEKWPKIGSSVHLHISQEVLNIIPFCLMRLIPDVKCTNLGPLKVPVLYKCSMYGTTSSYGTSARLSGTASHIVILFDACESSGHGQQKKVHSFFHSMQYSVSKRGSNFTLFIAYIPRV